MTIRWGILGASNFARQWTGPAIHAAAGARLCALATASVDKAAPFQAFCPDLRLHDSYDELLVDPGIDAVYIPLPNHLHVEWMLKALEAGKHVLCEKPIALTAGEMDRLIAARDRTGLLAAEAFMILHHPQWQRVRDMVKDGAIGELVHVSGRFTFDNRADTNNFRHKSSAGGGALRDIGVYVIGSARFVTGEEPTAVRANIRWENGVDTMTRIDADFQTFTYSAYVSTRMHLSQAMEFHGNGGLIRLTAPFNPRDFGESRIELHQPALGMRVERFPVADQYKLQVEAFSESIKTGKPFACPLEFSRGTQAMIDQIFAASPDPG